MGHINMSRGMRTFRGNPQGIRRTTMRNMFSMSILLQIIFLGFLKRESMLVEEAKYWWENTCARLEVEESFKNVFLAKYFSKDMRERNDMKFLELKQGNSIVVDDDGCFSSRFEHLSNN
ncbi:hypothetical protein CR513_30838, partial [Mucuna pruriens]